MEISSLLEDNNPSQRKAALNTVNKWERTGLLEGLKSETEKAGMAQLLENQARQLVKEASSTGTTEGSEEWAGVALPLVRRIFAEFAAKEFVSVQPMNLPSGLVFYLDFKYGTAQPGFDDDNADHLAQTGDPFGPTSAADSMFGITTTENDPSGGLYGAGRFGYSINELAVTASAAAPAAATSASVNYDSAYTDIAGFGAAGGYSVVSIPLSSLSGSDDTAVRSFILSTASAGTVNQISAFTKVNAAKTHVEFVITGSAGLSPSAGEYVVKYSAQPSDISRGDFEDSNPFKGSGANGINQGTDIDIPEVNLEMQSDPIVAKTRKLKAVWDS